jgi:hypothetical protein
MLEKRLKAVRMAVSMLTLGAVNAMTGRGTQGLFSERADTLQKLDGLLNKFGMSNIKEAEAFNPTADAKVVIQEMQEPSVPIDPDYTKKN